MEKRVGVVDPETQHRNPSIGACRKLPCGCLPMHSLGLFGDSVELPRRDTHIGGASQWSGSSAIAEGSPRLLDCGRQGFCIEDGQSGSWTHEMPFMTRAQTLKPPVPVCLQ